MRIILYLLSIVAANIITAEIAPIQIGMIIIPAGSFLIGCTFILRDLNQMKYGRAKTYAVIFTALALSGVMAVVMGDGLQIVIASLVAFLFSEAMDTEIFTRLKGTTQKKVLFSGIVGGLLDSGIFAVVGLSPWGLGILDWQQTAFAVVGQTLTKMIMQFAGVGIWNFTLFAQAKRTK